MQKEIKDTKEIDDTLNKKEATNKNECNELKTLKYKTLLMNGIVWPETKSSSDLVNLDKFLENEKNNNANEPWSKLDKTAKTKKLTIFAENYKIEHNLSEDEYNKLTIFLKDCLDRKKLQRVKDVIYDKTNGEVKDVPALYHNKQSNHFTLKNTEKHISTTRSLAPKKARGTAKNVVNYDSDTSI
jgi:hypothetical protein